jgi:hypothetical protein
MDRKPLSILVGKTISSIEDAPRNDVYLCGPDGKPFARVCRDDIFDEEGNRFEDDL